MKIYIIIPFHNEGGRLAKVIKGLDKYKHHIVLVDDGSTDSSNRKLQESKNPRIQLLTHKVNLGKGAAMKTGAEWAFNNGADAVIFMDGDNQHHPSDLPKFVKKLESGKVEAVFGARNFTYGVPLVRFLGNKFASVIMAFCFGISISDVLCGYKALTKEGYKKIKWESAGYGVETEMIARAGKRKIKFTEVPVRAIYHDSTKGVTILDAFGIMGEIVKWKLTIK